MDRLGYTHYVAQGGDQGASVTDAMARLAPDGLVGIHLNFLSAFPIDVLAAVFGAGAAHGLFKRFAVAFLAEHAEHKEREALEAVAAIFKRGYIIEMPEHPQMIGFALTDSPVGLAAWMLDHDADSYEKISRAFVGGSPTGGLILDNITLYWLTQTATSARIYWGKDEARLPRSRPGRSLPSSRFRWPSPSSPTNSSRPPAAGPRRSTPTSSTSTRSTRAATSPPGNSPTSSPPRCAPRSARCADHVPTRRAQGEIRCIEVRRARSDPHIDRTGGSQCSKDRMGRLVGLPCQLPCLW